MPIRITINGQDHSLATSDELLQLANHIAEVEATGLNNGEQFRLLQQQVKAILNDAPSPAPVQPPAYDGIVLSPGDNLQEAVLDAGGQQIWLKDGTYRPVEVVSGTRIKAINTLGATISSAAEYGNGWVKSGQAWYKDLDIPMYQHPANAVHSENGSPSARGLAHRRAMQPHMLIWEGEPMQPVYSASDLVPGTFMLEGTAGSPKGLWARFPGDTAPDEKVRFADSQYLVRGKTADVDGVELEGLNLQYCSNTGTFSAIHMEMDQEYWLLSDLHVSDSMAEGVRLRGSNHVVQRCGFNYHGHVGIAGQGLFKSQIIDCSANLNVWRHGVDPLWHAGGLKWQYGCNENFIQNYKADGNNGAGFWLDIWNVDNIIDGFELTDNQAFGMHIEHNSKGTIAKNGLIRGTRKFNAGNHAVGSGLQIQGAIFDCLFLNIRIEGNEDGAVYYKKEGDPRGNSGRNKFEAITYVNNGNNNRWVIQGDIPTNPDTYLRMQQPNFTNWG